jgi:serine/threonine protein kinase
VIEGSIRSDLIDSGGPPPRPMGSRIFLSKYRVSGEEIAAIGEPVDRPVNYAGEEIDSGKKVRVETVPIASLKKEEREQLEANAAATKKLNHVNIPTLYGFGVQDGKLVYIREDIQGTSVEQWVNTHGPMPLGPVLRITSQVVSALGTAGFQRIVHRAINPANIILVPGQTTEGEWPLIKVLNFDGVTSKPGLDKSSQYVSPEQLRYNVVDFRSEIYSLGATMWFLLTGAPPPMGPEGLMAVSSEKTASAEDPVAAMPEKLRGLLAKMLSIIPSSRPRDTRAFYLLLQECLNQTAPRELVSRTLGPLPVSPSHDEDLNERRRFPQIPMNVIVLMAVLLAILVPTFLFLPSYLRRYKLGQTARGTGVRSTVPNVVASPKVTSTPASTGGPIVMLGSSPSGSQRPSPAGLNVTLVSFTPMAGKPGGKDYQVATLTFKIEATSPVPVTEASFYVDSAPFTDGGTRSQPITLFVHKGVFLGPPGTVVDAKHPMERTIWLKSEGNLSSNWTAAYTQTDNATFRWVIGGQPAGGSAVKPLHQAWSSSRPTPEVRRAQPAKPE